MVCTPVMHTLLRSACSAVEAKISVPSGKKEIKNLCECDWPNNILLSRKCHLLVLAKGVSQGLFYQPAHRVIINKSYNIPVTYVVNWDFCCGPGKHNPLYHAHSVRCHELDFLFFVFLPSVRKCTWAMLLKALELDVSFQRMEQASTAGVVPLRFLLLTSGSGSMALPSRGCEQEHHPSGRAAAGAWALGLLHGKRRCGEKHQSWGRQLSVVRCQLWWRTLLTFLCVQGNFAPHSAKCHPGFRC